MHSLACASYILSLCTALPTYLFCYTYISVRCLYIYIVIVSDCDCEWYGRIFQINSEHSLKIMQEICTTHAKINHVLRYGSVYWCDMSRVEHLIGGNTSLKMHNIQLHENLLHTYASLSISALNLLKITQICNHIC